MDDEAREVELKFLINPTPSDAANGEEMLQWIGGGAAPTVQTLTSIYFDTPRHLLRRGGFVLRLRGDGRRWMQTVKSIGDWEGRLGRGEWELQALGRRPDLAMLAVTPAGKVLPRGARLAPRFKLIVERRSVTVDQAGVLIEASVDTGRIEVAGRSAPVHELELELKSGDPTGLFDLARRLQEQFPIGLAFATKADRGFALLTGASAAAHHFQPPALHRRMTAGAAFRALARAALEQIAGNAALLNASPTAEIIHQTRVGIRRLRATMAAFRPVIDGEPVARLKAELKMLGGELDAARDLDVCLAGACRRAISQGNAVGAWPAFGRRLRAARKLGYARATLAVAGSRGRTLLLDLLEWIEVGPWTAKAASGAAAREGAAAAFAAARLDKDWRRVLRKGRKMNGMTSLERHKLRIKARKLRYVAEELDDLFDDHPKRARRFLDALKTLLGELGDLNDIAAAETLAVRHPPAPDVGASEAARKAERLAAAAQAFNALRSAKPFWKT